MDSRICLPLLVFFDVQEAINCVTVASFCATIIHRHQLANPLESPSHAVVALQESEVAKGSLFDSPT
jgi:hypothetical protein